MVQLVPVALPSDAKVLTGIADAVADYNRALADNETAAQPPATFTAEGSASSPTSDTHPCCHLTPWLAASLAPIGAAVTIQAHWRGRAERLRQGALLPQVLSRRAAVCIQRAWRMCKYYACSLSIACSLFSLNCLQPSTLHQIMLVHNISLHVLYAGDFAVLLMQ